jgi:ComF family protein
MPVRGHRARLSRRPAPRIVASTRRLRHLLLDALLPIACIGCGGPVRGFAADDGPLCGACRLNAPWPAPPLCASCGVPLGPPSHAVVATTTCAPCRRHPPAFATARGAALYHPAPEPSPLVAAVHALKYRRERALALSLAALVMARLPVPHGVLVVPVPLHPARLRERRFNQAALIAASIARRSGRPLAVRALVRRVPTSPQAGLGAGERRRNLHAAFAVPRPSAVAGRRILLVDDVITTGATADACARALRHAGAVRVDVYAAGRTPIGAP